VGGWGVKKKYKSPSLSLGESLYRKAGGI
jgi:hypothetical protein